MQETPIPQQEKPILQQEEPIPEKETLIALQELNLASPRPYADVDAEDSAYDNTYNAQSPYHATLQAAPLQQDEYPLHALDPNSQEQLAASAISLLPFEAPPSPGPSTSTSGSYVYVDARDSAYDETCNAQSEHHVTIPQGAPLQQDEYPLHASHALDPYSQEPPAAPAFSLFPFEIPPSPSPSTSTSGSFFDGEVDVDSAYDETYDAHGQSAYHASAKQSAPLQRADYSSELNTAAGYYIAYPPHGSHAQDPYSPGQPADPVLTLFPFGVPNLVPGSVAAY
ncbi:g9016 [Coccomyxa viridis]|uniref:G9016 protein n=1 Tax=Coccomyxa viridis TaxID=1274662 RepID=A0ABP1G4E7_9CHLO